MKNKELFFLSVIFLVVILSAANTYSREVKSINANWHFSYGVEIPRGLGWGGSQEASSVVNLPHTANGTDPEDWTVK